MYVCLCSLYFCAICLCPHLSLSVAGGYINLCISLHSEQLSAIYRVASQPPLAPTWNFTLNGKSPSWNFLKGIVLIKTNLSYVFFTNYRFTRRSASS